ncbi:MAG: putative entry exclusion protein TrbK-alt [Hyphomicrobium sp.]|jgi:conjugative transfer region protein TrbK|uniref:putative entry exclusion protein TrbK-alt n=1 Tax=Hyphomicrobium sp. TaxID=82 RepID=UPI003562CF0B
MRGRFLNLPAIARAVGFALVAIAIIAATPHFREAPLRSPDHAASPAATSDPLSDELNRCQVLAAQAEDDAGCEAAWAESRHRFFTYRQPSNTTTPPAALAKSPDR